jgi:small subunit ribosomal protein S11
MSKIYIYSSLNNTILTLVSMANKVLNWSSPGAVGFKNSQKSNSYAVQLSGQELGRKCKLLNIKSVSVVLKGIGYGKKQALIGLMLSGVKIKNIIETTPIPFNGCKSAKKRRI